MDEVFAVYTYDDCGNRFAVEEALGIFEDMKDADTACHKWYMENQPAHKPYVLPIKFIRRNHAVD